MDEHEDLELDREDDDHEGEEDTAAGVMTKAELVDEVARVVQLTKKQAEMIVNIVFDSIVDSLRSGQKIELRGFGSFRLRSRKSRTGRNPKTGEKVEVPSKKIPYFKPGKELKELINKALAEAEAAESRTPEAAAE
ncbi:MAG TPA: integration host factor subunit beta [Thermoanaerobaculia bacterium]|nr:integration host factor subunit beta [Thermoanaerobaculia bacterium]